MLIINEERMLSCKFKILDFKINYKIEKKIVKTMFYNNNNNCLILGLPH
jgi:hypothetical protein